MSRLSIMPHAVERYRERWAPHLTPEQAHEELLRLSEGARPEKAKTKGGQELWVANDATRKILFVVKRDRGTRERICVTVLPEGAMEDGTSNNYEEYVAYDEERQEMLREMGLMRARTDGTVCQTCDAAVATKFSTKKRQRFCTPCHTSADKASLGRCYPLTEWSKKSPEEQQEALSKPPTPPRPEVKPEVLAERPEKRAAEVFRQLYSGCAWFMDVQPSETAAGKKFLLVSVTRMLESHESRFLRDFMGLPVRLDVVVQERIRAQRAERGRCTGRQHMEARR